MSLNEVEKRDEAAPERRDAATDPKGVAEWAETLKQKPGLQMFLLLLLMLTAFSLRDLWIGAQSVEAIPYSQFETLLEQGAVEEVVLQGTELRGRVRAPLEGGKSRFVTQRVDPALAERLAAQEVIFGSVPENTLVSTLLSWLLPIALLLAVWTFVMRRAAQSIGGGPNGMLSIGKSKAKVYVESDIKVGFDDVAGVDESKAELQEVVEFLRNPRSYGRLGARMPKGILLVGPPGTGKTLLARAVAGEAEVPFFSISGSEFVEMFVGVGAARVRDLFEQASQQAPCIIFVDELDALGKARNSQAGFGGHDEKEQTLNQLLVELDGFDPRSGIVLLAATNRPEILDPALLRAGRFDRQILVDRPDRLGREAVLRVHLRGVQAAADLALDKIASLTPGFTGADLENLVNEAALVATRRRGAEVGMADFDAAIERIVGGLEKRNRLLNPRERQIVAHHEMGHALVAACLPGTDRVHKVSIIPRGIGALGYTLQRPTEDRYLMTREEMDAKLMVLQGGRAAEFVTYGHFSTGAADDLARATDIARSMVTRYAMVPELGSVTYGEATPSFLGTPDGASPRLHSEQTAREIDEAVRATVDTSFERATALLGRNRDVLEQSAAALLERETLDEADLRMFFERLIPWSPSHEPVAVNF